MLWSRQSLQLQFMYSPLSSLHINLQSNLQICHTPSHHNVFAYSTPTVWNTLTPILYLVNFYSSFIHLWCHLPGRLHWYECPSTTQDFLMGWCSLPSKYLSLLLLIQKICLSHWLQALWIYRPCMVLLIIASQGLEDSRNSIIIYGINDYIIKSLIFINSNKL